MRLDKQRKLRPIAFVTLTSSTLHNRKGNHESQTYADRQFHTATILQTRQEIGRIKLEAINASVRLWDITIHLMNGRSQKAELPDIIDHNRESPFIELEEEGEIKMITISLNALRVSDKTPVIWIWGL
jgi:hypothetical protein